MADLGSVALRNDVMAAIPPFGIIANPPQIFPRSIALPAQNPFGEPAASDAYQQCLLQERDACNDRQKLVWPRLLGFLLIEAPTDEGRKFLAHQIIECRADRDMVDLLAKFYVDHLFRLFRANKGHTPDSSEHSSRSPFETHRSFFSTAIVPAPSDHSSAKRAALERDGHRCMVTNAIEMVSFRGLTVEQRIHYNLIAGPLQFFTVTNFCHIFPPSTNWDLKPEELGHPKTSYSGNVWGIINGFGGIDVLSELDGTNIHGLHNGLTLSLDVHASFDGLWLWFEECLGLPNTYAVQTELPGQARISQSIVTFQTNTDLPLPDPRYLKLHAAVCRVAHMSGAAEYLDSYDRKIEKIVVLAQDGTSADILSHRLMAVSLMA